jgi:hypothetical protein
VNRRLAVVAVLAGCASAPVPAPPSNAASHDEPRPLRPVTDFDFDIAMTRNTCVPVCGAYEVHIHRDGKVVWRATANERTTATKVRHAGADELQRLANAVAAARFFERDEYGQLPMKWTCVDIGTATKCSSETEVCVGNLTALVVIEAVRDGDTHRVMDSHCLSAPELVALEQTIDELAGVPK